MPRTQALMAFLPSLFHPYAWHWNELVYWDEKYPPCTYDYPWNEAKPQENWHLLGDYVRVLFLSFKLIKSSVTLWVWCLTVDLKQGEVLSLSPCPPLPYSDPVSALLQHVAVDVFFPPF